MLRYSKIMQEKVVIFGPPSSLQLWVPTNEWSDPQTDPTISFWLLHFFLQRYHSMLYLLPLQSPMVGRILDRVPGHTSIGRSRNFVHLVTGHTPGRINRNGTVSRMELVFFVNPGTTARRLYTCVVCATHVRTCTARTSHALTYGMAVILLIRGCVANNVPESSKWGDADFLVQKQISTSHSQDINYGTSILAQITTSVLWSRN